MAGVRKNGGRLGCLQLAAPSTAAVTFLVKTKDGPVLLVRMHLYIVSYLPRIHDCKFVTWF